MLTAPPFFHANFSSARYLVLTAPPWIHANFCCLPLCSPVTNYSLCGPCLSLVLASLSLSGPLTTSGYGEISCPRILCLVSRQNRQLNRLLWQPTPIVLHREYLMTSGGSVFDLYRGDRFDSVVILLSFSFFLLQECVLRVCICVLLFPQLIFDAIKFIGYLIVCQGGTRGVMVIVTGYGHGDTSSIPGQDWLHFT